MGQKSFLPEIDRKQTQAAVLGALETYRLYKYLTFQEREASTTAAYSDMPRSSPTNVTTDQTASIAIHNADEQRYRQEYCARIEDTVYRMPMIERFLIEQRYMTREHDYITDTKVYSVLFQPPITWDTYNKIRWRAIYKLALDLNLAIEKEQRRK